MHERARLGILASLISRPNGLAFSELKQLCGLTDGNLSRHIQVLQEAGLVSVQKGFSRKRPLTTCRMTARGRKRFLEYLSVLEQIVEDAALAAETSDIAAGAFEPRPA